MSPRCARRGRKLRVVRTMRNRTVIIIHYDVGHIKVFRGLAY